MYAVIKTGGKQYKVTEGDVVKVEKLPLDAGQVVAFDEVLMLGEGGTSQIGSPNVVGASVKATVLEQGRADKIVVFKKRRRQNSRQKNGHRQAVTVVRVTEILGGAAKRKAATKKSTESSKTKTPSAKSKKVIVEEKSPSEE